MMLRFVEWLTAQQGREDLIGDLARVPSMQALEPGLIRRKPDEHQSWADIVIRIAEPGYIAVFNDAWREYLLAREEREEAEDTWINPGFGSTGP